MPDLHYDDPVLAELYDITCGWSKDRDFYLDLAGEEPKRVLDLGCGTGILCDAYRAKGHQVTGVDPSPAMLDVARRKLHGGAIEWVHSTAQAFETDERFDLTIMTGHAFQTLIGNEAIDQAIAGMYRHCTPSGIVAFESRNPAYDWKAEWDGATDDHAGHGFRVVVEVQSHDGERIHFDQRYEFRDKVLVSHSELRFLAREDIEGRLRSCGFAIEYLFGDWDRAGFDPERSREMIFIARRDRA